MLPFHVINNINKVWIMQEYLTGDAPGMPLYLHPTSLQVDFIMVASSL